MAVSEEAFETHKWLAEEIYQHNRMCEYFSFYEIITGNYAKSKFFKSDLRSVKPEWAFVRFILVMFGFAACGFSTTVSAVYFGENDAVSLKQTGCNSVSYAPVPGESSLFIGRQFFKSDGSAVTREEGCGANSPAVSESIKANRWGLVLDRLNWAEKSFTIVKPLLITPAKITGGPMHGAIIEAAYDPDVVLYHGQYWVAFECVLANKEIFRVDGTSSCLAAFDIAKQKIRLDTVYVVVSGKATDEGRVFHSASVPSLLVVNDSIYLYWSEVTVAQGKFVRIGVRGAVLEADGKGYLWVKDAGGMAYSIGLGTVEVWGPDPKNTLSNTAVDLKSIWVNKNDIVALVSLGGAGCTTPSGGQPGCWRMAMAKVRQPLGDHIFNKSPLLDEAMLPTNPQDYTRPVKNPTGGYSFVGAFYKPVINGFSEFRPAPKDWSNRGGGQNIIFPFPDESLWPSR